MALTYQPVQLDADYGDSACMLVFRDGRLSAVLTCLGDDYDDLAGSWYLEASFSENLSGPRRNFASLDAFGEWAGTNALFG